MIEIEAERNRVVVGPLEALRRDGMRVRGLNMIKYARLEGPLEAVTKVRYGGEGTGCVLEQGEEGMRVFFGRGVQAIAPGQAAVFYEGEDVIGGGWIVSSFNQKVQ